MIHLHSKNCKIPRNHKKFYLVKQLLQTETHLKSFTYRQELPELFRHSLFLPTQKVLLHELSGESPAFNFIHKYNVNETFWSISHHQHHRKTSIHLQINSFRNSYCSMVYFPYRNTIFQKQVKMNNNCLNNSFIHFKRPFIQYYYVCVCVFNELRTHTHTCLNIYSIQKYHNMSNKASRVDLNEENRHKITNAKYL